MSTLLTNGGVMRDDIKPGYTRVSQILEMLPTLSNGKWGYPMQNIDPYILARAADRGTNVHAAIKAHWDGEFYPLDEKEQGYFESFKKWEAIIKPKHEMSEMRLYDDLTMVTGAADFIGRLGNSLMGTLIDFKTTASEDKKKWPLQAAFYHYLCHVNKIEIHREVLFVKLATDGSRPSTYEYDSNDEKIEAFAALTLFRHLTNY